MEAGHANHHDQNKPGSPPNDGGATCCLVRGCGGCPAPENGRADDSLAHHQREDTVKKRQATQAEIQAWIEKETAKRDAENQRAAAADERAEMRAQSRERALLWEDK